MLQVTGFRVLMHLTVVTAPCKVCPFTTCLHLAHSVTEFVEYAQDVVE